MKIQYCPVKLPDLIVHVGFCAIPKVSEVFDLSVGGLTVCYYSISQQLFNFIPFENPCFFLSSFRRAKGSMDSLFCQKFKKLWDIGEKNKKNFCSPSKLTLLVSVYGYIMWQGCERKALTSSGKP